VNPADLAGLPDAARVHRLPPFLNVAPYRAAAQRRETARVELASDLGLPSAPPWLLAVAMMRPGDKLASYRLLSDALRRIAETRSRFVSRGDRSGTHTLELGLWKQAGIEPQGAWYIESGQGMGQTLGIANDRRAYTVTDRGTWLAFQKRVSLPILVEKDRPLLNIYSVMEVNVANGPRVNVAGGKAFADFMLSPEVQDVIRTYGVDKYGQPLFVPIAGKTDADL